MTQSRPAVVALLLSLIVGAPTALAETPSPTVSLSPSKMPVIGTVDDRYQSYNIEMIQVMGGEWWAPYQAPLETTSKAPIASTTSAAGFGGASKRYRAPTNLADPKLRILAAALSPAYVRVTDTWANTVYFQDDAKAPAPPPKGFGAVITATQWKGLIDFSNVLDAKIVTSFSIAAGVRDSLGVWTPAEAQKLLDYTKRADGRISVAEFYNEPNLGVISGAPKGYDVQAYARDFKIFHDFVKATDPGITLLGPGPVGEGQPLPGLPKGLKSEDILRATGSELDGVSYHFYGALSQRCKALGSALQTSPEAALTKDWLTASNKPAAFYGELRDRFDPGKPVWLTETADAACGGNPWASDFIDTFRYLNQLGSLAKQSIRVVMHNTLAGSDYGLIDDVTLSPHPNYWAAVLWRRLMGTTVLEAEVADTPNLYVYAQCLRGRSGGVALLLINADRTVARQIELPQSATKYTLAATNLLGGDVDLNGRRLALKADNHLPSLTGAFIPKGAVGLSPASITFLAVANAGNSHCT